MSEWLARSKMVGFEYSKKALRWFIVVMVLLNSHMRGLDYSGQTALFLFLLARAAPAFLPTALSVALMPLFPFQQAQYVPVFLVKPAPFCTLFAGLGNTIKSSIFLLFLSDSRSVLASIFLLILNSVADLAGTVFSLLFYQATMGPRTLVSTGKRCG